MGPFEGYWPGFGSFWANFGGSEPGSGPIFWVLGPDFDLFWGSGPGFGSYGPIPGVMGLDLGLILAYFGFWAWIWFISGPFRGLWGWIWAYFWVLGLDFGSF